VPTALCLVLSFHRTDFIFSPEGEINALSQLASRTWLSMPHAGAKEIFVMFAQQDAEMKVKEHYFS
jgi:hypothetical protein